MQLAFFCESLAFLSLAAASLLFRLEESLLVEIPEAVYPISIPSSIPKKNMNAVTEVDQNQLILSEVADIKNKCSPSSLFCAVGGGALAPLGLSWN